MQGIDVGAVGLAQMALPGHDGTESHCLISLQCS